MSKEQVGDIISGKLGLRSHHKPSFLRVRYEQICRSEKAFSAASNIITDVQKARFAYGCQSRQGIDKSSSPAGVGVSDQARKYASVGTIHPACDWLRPTI